MTTATYSYLVCGVDYFGAYRSEAVASVGYGQQLFANDDMFLDAEIGPGVNALSIKMTAPIRRK